MKQKKEYYPNNNYGIYYFNASGKITKYKTNDNYWYKYKYNKNNDPIYYEDSYCYWQKWKYDEYENDTYYEQSDGHYGYRETMYLKEKEIEYYYLLAKEDKIIEKRHLYEDREHNLYQIRTGKKTFELKNNKYQKIKKGN